ncbi:integrase arm-type DNA-binding domain-containing protein [Stenotrophomonas maltophilia]|uniref:tyrosine-type recombinase/integrase n=1 Tax=Stenotrophomonas maltophilia TaxID=40324 RepID=UPI003454C870
MLTAVAVKNAGPGRHSDGGNLYLYVKKNSGRKTWVFRYRDRLTGKAKDLGLGSARDVSLAQAGQRAQQLRTDLAAGIDPLRAKRDALAAARRGLARQLTFGECARRCIETHEHEWRNAKHKAQWTSTLSTYCAGIEDIPVSDISVEHIRDVLERIWLTKTETATRVRARIERVLDWAKANNFRQGENPAAWRGNLRSLLPSPAKVKKVVHRAALNYNEVPALMRELAPRADFSASCLRLQILTATRPGEASAARWAEFNLDNRTWLIPGARTKTGRDHTVPLSTQAVALLTHLPTSGDNFLFPGKPGKPITTAAPLKLLKSLRPGQTCHGFRSSFRDWAAEVSHHSREAAELALGHVVKSKTEAAYFRSEMLKKRIPLMQDWADYCHAEP